MAILLKLNLGGQGAVPTVPSDWTNIWSLPYNDSDLTEDKDKGNVGAGIGLRCINDGSPNAWGENNNTAAHDLGAETGDDTGVYPDAVLKHGWFTNARVGKIELYNHTGTPLTGKSFTIRLLGSRAGLTQPRTTTYTVNGVSQSIDVDDNVDLFAEFTGVTAVNGIITILTTDGDPSDTDFAYLNAIEIEEEIDTIHLKLNLGGQGSPPSVPADWTNVWGQPYNDADLTQDIDKGDIGRGIGLRTINDGSPNAWGENNNVAAHDLGVVTGSNSGVYPDNVLKHGWFVQSRTGKIELYNAVGTPLTGKTFTINLLGSRAGLTQPRNTSFTIHGTTKTQDVDDNKDNVAKFTGVAAISNKITITVTNGTPSDLPFGYLNAIEIIEEDESPNHNITSVTNPASKSVAYGTAFADLKLPSQVTVTLDDSTTRLINVDWLQGSYNAQASATYNLTGNLVDLPAGITNSSNLTASIGVTVEAQTGNINLKLNIGGLRTAPSVAGWFAVWGQPYVDADLNANVDKGNVGFGIGLRCINDGDPNAWGENNNTAVHDLGKITGDNSGIYPDNVLRHGWFVQNRTGKIELYNHTGQPLNGKTFTIRLLGSRRDIGAVRNTSFSVNGVTKIQDVDSNTTTPSEFKNVSAQNGIITITTSNGSPTDLPYGYLNAIEIIQEGSSGPTPAQLYFDTYISDGQTKDVLVYTPPSFDPNVTYPVIFYYHGNGGKGAPNMKNNIAVGTGDGLLTEFGGTFDTPDKYRVLFNSVIVKVDGTQVAKGQANGKFAGSGVSGTMEHQKANGTFKIVFEEAPDTGAAITITYQRSQIFETGLAGILNQGDQPPGVIILSPQLHLGITDFSEVAEFADLKAYGQTKFNNKIDTNRVYITGLSRGARGSRIILLKKHTEVAAAIFMTAPDYNGLSSAWNNFTNIGTLFIMGTNDNWGNEQPSIPAAANQLTLNIYPKTLNIWRGTHSPNVWNSYCYDRQERTTASTVGAAPYDFVRWLKKHSKDALQRATLFVEYAEYSNARFASYVSYNVIEDYREALIQVNLLSASSAKTALLNRLSKLKAEKIDKNGGKRYIIDFGLSTDTTSGNYNNMTNHATSQSISNLVDDAGGSSTLGFTVVTASVASGQQAAIQGSRGNGIYFGLPRSLNKDGCVIGATAGIYRFTGLNNAKTYDVRIYHNEGSSDFGETFTALSELNIKIGTTTKIQYSSGNNLLYIEFKNVAPSSGQITFEAKLNDRGASYPLRNTYMTGAELFQNP